MKKVILATATILSLVGIAKADYKDDMQAILQSKVVDAFLTKNNLVLYGLQRTIGGLCPNNTPCPMFYQASVYKNGQKCVFYASVTAGQVKVEANEMIECR